MAGILLNDCLMHKGLLADGERLQCIQMKLRRIESTKTGHINDVAGVLMNNSLRIPQRIRIIQADAGGETQSGSVQVSGLRMIDGVCASRSEWIITLVLVSNIGKRK